MINLWSLLGIAATVVAVFIYARGMVKQMSEQEFKKFAFLSVIFGLLIGVYWVMRPLKDAIFMSMVGSAYIPQAKWLSVLVVLPIVLIYSKLIDLFPRHQVFYVLCTIYSVMGIGLAYLLNDPHMGLANTVQDSHRYLGWFWYVFIESYGSLFPALFWAFTADITIPETAKKATF
jgi:AAA family ATP:ADP antiporter